MKLMRNIIKISAGVITVAFLAGCGNNAQNGENGENGNGGGEPTPPVTTEAPAVTPTETPAPNVPPANGGTMDWDFEEIAWEHEFQRVVFQEGNPQMLVNNTWVDVYGGVAAPYVRDGVMYVPFEAARRAAGSSVVWERDGNNVTATLGQWSHTVEGEEGRGGTFAVPLIRIAERILRSYGWDETTGTLIVSSGQLTIPASISLRNNNRPPAGYFGSVSSLLVAYNLTYMQRSDGGWPRGTGEGDAGQPHGAEDMMITDAQRAILANHRTANDAYFGRGITTRETRFMLSMYDATRIEWILESALAGLDAILNAQFTELNAGEGRGGWPYYVTRREAHRGGVSFNDDSYVTIMELMFDIKNGEFPLLDDARRERASQAFDNGLDAILRLQIPSSAFADGQERLTAWAQHYDRQTGLPMWAREFEPPAISGSESVDVLQFLMSLPEPCERVKNAVSSAVYFFAASEVFGYTLLTGVPSPVNPDWGNDRLLVASEHGRGLWGRFICPETFSPIFSDRRGPNWRPGEERDRPGQLMPPPGGTLRHIYRADGTMDILASFANLSHERRNGYNYIGNFGATLPGEYQSWRNRHGL